jgi:ribosome-associated protein
MRMDMRIRWRGHRGVGRAATDPSSSARPARGRHHPVRSGEQVGLDLAPVGPADDARASSGDRVRAASPTAGMMAPMSRPPIRNVTVREVPIRLGQFLKLAGIAEDGGQARALLEEGAVSLNGRTETRRGAQLGAGDVVAVGPVRVRPVQE